MSIIEVQAPLETAQIVPVHEVSEPRDNAVARDRYLREAEQPGLTPMEVWAKHDTAHELAKLAAKDNLNHAVQQYMGNEKPTSR